MQQRAIKNKIKSTISIKKITRTMEMISVTKMRKSVSISENYKSFIKKGAETLRALTHNKDEIRNVFNNKKNNSNRDLYIIIAGQKGLCGAFNVNVYRKVSKHLSTERQADFISINKYGEKIARRLINNRDSRIIYSFNKKVLSEVDSNIILKYITESYIDNKYKNIYLVWTAYHGIANQSVGVKSLLPFVWQSLNDNLQINESSEYVEYIIEPNIHKVIENAIVVILSAFLQYAYYDSNTSEHIARMNAMHNATNNAKELEKDLRLYYNKTRQASITQEISEIVSGAIGVR